MSEKDMEYIRVAAYYMWENAGKPEGKDEEFWWKACEQYCGCSAKKAEKSVAKKASSKKALSKTSAKPVVKLSATKTTAKKATKSKISPLPVKSAAKIITPLYGSVKK